MYCKPFRGNLIIKYIINNTTSEKHGYRFVSLTAVIKDKFFNKFFLVSKEGSPLHHCQYHREKGRM